MAPWIWVVIALGVIVVLAAAAWAIASRRRTDTLRRQFGPEYDVALRSHETRREAEAELSGRVKRRRRLEIRPLPDAARERYLASWRDVQGQFVDAPEAAVANAHGLVCAAMAERGYPVEDFDQRVADVSVDHPLVVEHYRAAHTTAERTARGEASTEELRQAMQHYRALFDDLLETGADAPLTREAAEGASREELGRR